MEIRDDGSGRRSRPDLEAAIKLYRDWVRDLETAVKPLIPAWYTGKIEINVMEGGITHTNTNMSTKNGKHIT